MKDHLTAIGKLVPMTPDQFAQTTPHAVADNRPADTPRHTQPDATRPGSFRAAE
jgi:hypothetical protein